MVWRNDLKTTHRIAFSDYLPNVPAAKTRQLVAVVIGTGVRTARVTREIQLDGEKERKNGCEKWDLGLPETSTRSNNYVLDPALS